jgi:hypothetical protein
MDINMPAVTAQAVPKELKRCELYLAHRNDGTGRATVMRVSDEVAYFEPGDGITYSSYDYFKDQYTIVREYEKGESLTLTV